MPSKEGEGEDKHSHAHGLPVCNAITKHRSHCSGENGSMDKFSKRWSRLKWILLAWKPLLKVKFCVIIAWEIPSDVKKVFVIVGLV